MTADKWIFPLAIFLMCVSLSDEHHCHEYVNHTISASLGSSALLPCHFTKNNNYSVSWAYTDEDDEGLVHLESGGRIKFSHPRSGRVKAFPNEGSEGNYSICIDALEDSDQGLYACKMGRDCLQVELVLFSNDRLKYLLLLICITVGTLALVLLIIICYCLYKNKSQKITITPEGGVTEAGTNAPPAVTGPMPPLQEQWRGADNPDLVYENDDQGPISQLGDPTRNHHNLPGGLHHVDRAQPTQSTSGIYPNVDQGNFQRMERQSTKQRFHRDLFNRLRQASISRHHYVNQGEIRRQQAMAAQAENRQREGVGKKKAKEEHEYKNPIYNRSTDRLNLQ